MGRLIEKIPEDPMILFSFINMHLRDQYQSLDALCDDMGIDRNWLEDKLGKAGFTYSAENNKFW